MELWHQRLGHLGKENVQKLSRMNLVEGMDRNLEGKVKYECKGCLQGKKIRLPFGASSRRAMEKLHLVHTNVEGPFNIATYAGNSYFITFTDDCTRKVWVYLMKHKSQAINMFEKFKSLVEKETGMSIKCLRSDNGGEYTSITMKKKLESEGIRHELTVPYTPQQNGVAERLNRTLLESARAMIYEANMSKLCWGEAVLTAAYLKNRWPNASLEEMTPEEAWSGGKPDISHLRIFGSSCSVHIPDMKRTKLDAKSWEGYLVGYSETSKAYKVWNPKSRNVVVARDVIINEEKQAIQEEELPKPLLPSKGIITIEDLEGDEGARKEEGYSDEEESREEATPKAIRRSERTVKPVERYQAHLTSGSIGRCLLSTMVEPASLEEALSGEQREQWLDAVQEELKSLEEHQTWKVCNLPEGRKAIGCKWVFRIKEKQDGTVEKFKARLVAKGYLQKEGVDYQETFSPVVSHESLRLLFSYANNEGMLIHQMDVKSAFLNGY